MLSAKLAIWSPAPTLASNRNIRVRFLLLLGRLANIRFGNLSVRTVGSHFGQINPKIPGQSFGSRRYLSPRGNYVRRVFTVTVRRRGRLNRDLTVAKRRT